MLTNKNLIAVAGVLAGAFGVGQAASATDIVQHWDFLTTGALNTLETYQLFNQSIGTLTGVKFELVSATNAEVDIFNSNGPGQTFTNAHTSTTVSIAGPPSAFVYVSETLNGNVASGTVNAPFTPFAGLVDNKDVTDSVLATNFSHYQAIGGGTSGENLTLNITSPTSGVTAVAGIGAGGSATASGTLYLTYSYDSFSTTPEPGTWALVFASASVSLVGLRRRRATK